MLSYGDTHWDFPENKKLRGRKLKIKKSFYLRMHDEVDLAITYHIPEELYDGEKFPVIFQQTRYYRELEWKFPWNLIFKSETQKFIRESIRRGFAYVIMDVRGSGASFGFRETEWSKKERTDATEVLDWIIDQDWCDGSVGLYGNSYDGTAAEFLYQTGNPAIKGIVSKFSLFDVYSDIAYPGGVKNIFFIREWYRLNRAMDSNRLQDFFGLWLKIFINGIKPVERNEPLLKTAITQHFRNWNIVEEAESIKFRDDTTKNHITIQNFSLHKAMEDYFSNNKKNKNSIPFLAISGWWDGEYCKAAINKFTYYNNTNFRLIIGPWDHGADFNISKTENSSHVRFNFIYEILNFFDNCLKRVPQELNPEKRIYFFTMGKNQWKSSTIWPPPFKSHDFFIHPEKQLLLYKTLSEENMYEIRPNSKHSTGTGSRWNSMINPRKKKIGYPDRISQLKHCFTFKTLPIQEEIDISGSPEVILFLRTSNPETDLFLYLDELSKDGKVNYITESVHKLNFHTIKNKNKRFYNENYFKNDYVELNTQTIYEFSLNLLPVSFTVNKESKILLSIAGYDIDHFSPLEGEVPVLDIFFGKKYPSGLKIPVEINESTKPQI